MLFLIGSGRSLHVHLLTFFFDECYIVLLVLWVAGISTTQLPKCVQRFLRAGCDDDLAGEKAHRYSPLTGNQWIEAWWSYYRRSCLTWWITFFKDLMDRGVFLPGNTLHQECLWFCFAELRGDLCKSGPGHFAV